MDAFQKHIMVVSYGHCWCVDCRVRVDKSADRRRARCRLKNQDRRERAKGLHD